MFLLFLPWWRLHEGQSLVCCKTRSLRSSARGPTALFTWCYQQLIQCLVLWLSWMARCSGSALIIPSTPCCAPEEEPIPPSLWRGMNLRDMVLLLFIPLCLPDVGRGKLRRDPWCAFLGGVGLSTSPTSSHCNISEGEHCVPRPIRVPEEEMPGDGIKTKRPHSGTSWSWFPTLPRNEIGLEEERRGQVWSPL